VTDKSNTQKKTEYSYSPNGTLESAGTQHFEYNLSGNQTQNNQVYNSLNQLIEDKETLYAYDERGNLKEKLDKATQQRSLYVFNLFNQLEKVKIVDKQDKLIEGFSFSYDALNRRVSKTTVNKDLKSTTHHYLYDDENIVAILDHNKELLASIVHDSKTDTPLSITTYNNEAKPYTEYETLLYKDLDEDSLAVIEKQRTYRTYYYHRAPQGHFRRLCSGHHQGSITALTDEDNNIVESFLYDDAYGTILDHHTTVQTYNPYCNTRTFHKL